MMFPQQTAAPAAPGQRLVAERRWRLGVHSRGHPHRIIEDLLRALHTLSVGYKKVAPYNYKCRKLYPARGMFVCAIGSPMTAQECHGICIAMSPHPQWLGFIYSSGPTFVDPCRPFVTVSSLHIYCTPENIMPMNAGKSGKSGSMRGRSLMYVASVKESSHFRTSFASGNLQTVPKTR